jgi:hypothetical protein
VSFIPSFVQLTARELNGAMNYPVQHCSGQRLCDKSPALKFETSKVSGSENVYPSLALSHSFTTLGFLMSIARD